jgi:hypothetical protein
MLISLELENFKGIAARQRIDFAPLTLLFGANSAGKSTILQALLYLHELIARGSADIDRTEIGGNVLELGGFARLVHRHRIENAIVLRAEFATPGGLERFGRDLTDFPFPDLDDDVISAWIELKVTHRAENAYVGPMVESMTVGIGGHADPLVWVDTVGYLRPGDPLYLRVNLAHPTIRTAGLEVLSSWAEVSVPEPLWHGGVDPSSGQHVLGLDDIHGIDDEYGPMPLFAVPRSRVSAVPPLNEPLRILVPEEADVPENQQAILDIRTFLEMSVLGTVSQLAAFLSSSLYVGPLRTVPPRGFLYERAGRITSWADGLAAWDLLLADRLTLVERTNLWLKRLGAGCQIAVQQLFDHGADAEELSVGNVDKTVRRLLLDTGAGSFVLPSEVGAGVSQIIPVVVAAAEGRSGLTMIEQPEIHVHPAVQVNLGDVFIDAVTREGSRRILLVETHSEHLLLRVMRRMRETSEGSLPEGGRPVHPRDVSIMLVEKDESRSIVRRMPLNERGELVKAWPGGFFEEGLREVFSDGDSR